MHLIINYKNYPNALQNYGIDFTRELLSLRLPQNLELVVCPPAFQLGVLRQNFPELNLWAQHVDDTVEHNASGWVTAPAAVAAGAQGVVINHPSRPLNLETTGVTLSICNQHNLLNCVIVDSITTAKQILPYKPAMIAFEPPELIGANGSLMTANPSAAQDFITELSPYGLPLLIGAGITSATEIAAALKLGYQGIVISAALMKSETPAAKLTEIYQGFDSVN